jgi:hypothetical protein
MSGKMTTLLVVQVGCADGWFASTAKLDRRPLPSIVHIACAKQEIMEQAAIAIHRLLGVTERISISSARRYAATRHQLPPPVPRGWYRAAGCLEGTRKDSTASGASPWIPGPQPLMGGGDPPHALPHPPFLDSTRLRVVMGCAAPSPPAASQKKKAGDGGGGLAEMAAGVLGTAAMWVASTGSRAAGGEAQTPRLVGACERQARGF